MAVENPSPFEAAWIPDDCLLSILDKVSDKNSFSVTCKRFLELDNKGRRYIRLGTGLHPANEALHKICSRFTFVETIHINYLGWASSLGAQIGDSGLQIIANKCQNLRNLSLSFCGFITDAGLASLSAAKALKSLTLNFTPGVLGWGLLSVVIGCDLEQLHVERCLKLRSLEWLEVVGRKGLLKRLTVSNCRGIGEGDLAKLGAGWNSLEELTFEQDVHTKEALLYPVESFPGIVPLQFSSLKVLRLVNCPRTRGEGLAQVLLSCKGLEELSLFSCPGILDDDIERILQANENMQFLSLKLYKHLGRSPVQTANAHGITTACLPHIALHCQHIRELQLQCQDEFPSSASIFGGFADEGIRSIVKNCTILQKLSIGKGLHVSQGVLDSIPRRIDFCLLGH